MTAATYRRARSDEHKAERSAALLATARRIAGEHGVRAVTLTGIAEGVGLHHSALRRYFTSHNELLLLLAAEGWAGWAERFDATLPERGRPTPEELARLLVSALAEDPVLCDLLANAPTRLEHQVDVEFVRTFKIAVMAAVRRMSAAIERSDDRLQGQRAVDVVAAATAIAAMAWQVSHPAPAFADVYADDPDLAHLAADFRAETERLLAATIVGLRAEA